MQRYAWDQEERSVAVEQAKRSYDYRCPECQGIVRLREGLRRQRHYYHLGYQSHCRQSGKGAEHLQIQEYLLRTLPAEEAVMEMRFATIGRIADVAWPKHKIVFEVQCAAMTPIEALARTADYRQLGWQIIWILHAKRYLPERTPSPLVAALATIPHYFSTIDASGQVIIYDQLSLYRKQPALTLPRRTLALAEPITRAPLPKPLVLPQEIAIRAQHWPLHCQNDYLTLLEDTAFWRALLAYEQRCERPLPASLWQRYAVRPYHLLLQYLLEHYSMR